MVPFFCLLLFLVVHLLCVFILSLLFSFVLFFPSLVFWLYCFLCLFLEAKGGQIKKEGHQRNEEIKTDKKKEEKGNPQNKGGNFGKRLFVLFPSAVYLKHPLPKGAKNTEKTRFSLVLPHSLKIKHHTKTNQKKNKSGGATI